MNFDRMGSNHVMLSEAKHLVAQDEPCSCRQMLRFTQHDMVAVEFSILFVQVHQAISGRAIDCLQHTLYFT